MRFSAISYLLAGAVIAQYAAAAPLRVVVVTSSHEVNTHLRPGQPLGPLLPAFVSELHTSSPPSRLTGAGPTKPRKGRHVCAKMRDQAERITNAFRHALGLPVVTKPEHKAHGDRINIMPLPINTVEGKAPGGERVVYYNASAPSFSNRLHQALVTLGPWEGRAVAFVLGCGIGVLVRMFWVMTILLYRTIKGGREETHEYTIVLEGSSAEGLLVAPPHYTYENGAGSVEVVDVKTTLLEEPSEKN